ncbi:GNAT family N-acetyltransferase [Evansella sp. AB-rgal1]|uniref:GNAT family N-acetyltransferase n=1 Tax=Evansella sp. AB-rgal1 TaxID=3242696 RepID=UPI00359E3E56
MNFTSLKDIPTIETQNFLLRGISLEDAESLYSFMSDRETMKYITPFPVTTLEEMENKVNDSIESFLRQKEIPWVIIHKADNELIGMFRFHKLHLWHKKTEMGAVIRDDFQRKGVMTEILKPLLEFGFLTLQLNRIVGDLFASNKGSQRLMGKFGFHKDGQLRQTDFDGEEYHDTIVYSLLKSEYDAQNKGR